MINVTNLVSEFSAPDLQAYINEYNLGDLAYRNFFPTQYTPKLTFEALEAEFGALVAADVVAFDSRAPRKGRQLPAKIAGDIPKVEIARSKKESDLNTYRELVAAIQMTSNIPAASASAKRRLVDWMYEDTTFCLNGVNARMEWLAKQIASKGEYQLAIANNEGGVVTPVKIKFGIPTGNIANSATNWWAASNVAKPFSDIKALETSARAAGHRILYLTMDKATFDQMVLSDEVQKQCASFVANALSLLTTPNLVIVNQALANQSLPQIRIWDSYVKVEAKGGTLTTTSGWELGNVTATTSPLLGTTEWTMPAEAMVQDSVDPSLKSMNDLALIKTFASQDPIEVVTKGVAYATPIMRNVKSTYILKTKQS